MRHPSRSRQFHPALAGLEDRALMSHVGGLSLRPAAVAALVHRGAPRLATDPAGIAAVMDALNGGMGSEWVRLARSNTRNLAAVIGGFVSGRTSIYSVPGLIFKTPAAQPGFTGQPYDQLLPTAVGAAVFRRNILELGAILRGPFHDPDTTYYTFALNRGSGQGLGPTFVSRPGITPDALVTLTVGPYGSTASGTITDLTNGAVQQIDPANIVIKGATLRVFLNTNQLPSKGWPIQRYRFAFWSQTQPGNDLTTVADIVPAGSMNPIGVMKNVSVTR